MRLAGFALLLCGAAWAQSSERHVSDLEEAIKKGLIAAIHDAIQVQVVSTPEYARRLCRAAAECSLDMGLQEQDALKDTAEKMKQIGVRVSEDSPDSADAWSAAADGTYFRLRVLTALGEKTTTEEWLAVADALARQQELVSEDSTPLERAFKYLREGQRANGPDTKVLRKREEDVCAEGVKRFPKSTVFLRIAQTAELEEVVMLLRAKGEKEAKPKLEALLAKAADDTAYNDCVTVAKDHFKKLGIKVEYRTEPKMFFEHVAYEVPKGDRWKVERDALTQYGRDGNLLRRFSLDWFKRNTNYVLGDTEYDGSNEKGMALISERDVLSVIVKTKRKTGVIKKAMNRHISGVQYFVIGGWDKDGDFNRFHTYLWKSDQRTWLTYRLWIIELQDLPGLDAEAQFVLDSMTETKYEGKDK